MMSHVAVVTAADGRRTRIALSDAQLAAGVTLGGDPRCTIVLDGAAPVVAVVFEWHQRIFSRPVADFPAAPPRLPVDGDDEIGRVAVTITGQHIRVYRYGGTPVRIWIRDPGSERERAIELGDFHEVWANGITIGSDPSCTLVLVDLPSRAATLTSASVHRYLSTPDGDARRVDRGAFALGRYTLRIEE